MSAPSRGGELGLHDEVRSDRHRLILSGELDLASSPSLQGAVEQLCAGGAAEVVLDLRGLLFIDSTGVRTILHAVDLCRRRGCEIALIRGSATTQRLFELTGLEQKLPFRAATHSEEGSGSSAAQA